MPKKEFKQSKSTRKPLRDVSNGTRPSKSVKSKKAPQDDDGQAQDEALDRLLLVHSDLSSLIHQIDELVVQALKVTTSKKGRKEIESFTQVLSEIQSSLKPWAPILQKALSNQSGGSENLLAQPLDNRTVPILDEGTSDVVCSPEQTKFDSLVSPSPLVSWRADCTAEGGRQLFLLTPLPRPKAFSSKLQGSSKGVMNMLTSTNTAGVPSVSAIYGDTNDYKIEGVAVEPSKVTNAVENTRVSNLKPQFTSPPKLSKMDCSALVMTPCLKMSPPKSCVLLEPISELSHKNTRGVRKSTPFPVAINEFSRLQLSESSGSEVSEELALKYPELFGIRPPHKRGNRRKGVEASPDWFMSPPKTCVLMEPPEEKSFASATNNCPLPSAVCVQNKQTHLSLARENAVQIYNCATVNSLNEELGGGSVLIESTPMWKEPETALRTGKRPGEHTLKKELWTRFEAATIHGTRVNASALQESAQKGFLDRLDEVSRDETSCMN